MSRKLLGILVPEGYCKISEYAARVGAREDYVDYLVHAGRVEYIRLGNRRFVKSDSEIRPAMYAARQGLQA